MNRKILCVLRISTRSMKNQKGSSMINNQHIANKTNLLNEPNIYVPINNSDIRKYYKFKVSPKKFYIKKGKSILANKYKWYIY